VTPRQRQALDFIAAYQSEQGGVSPTLDEIGAALGIRKTNVHALLKSLAAEGRITFGQYRRRSIEIVSPAVDLSLVADETLLAEVRKRGLL
jgi:SOS-response transcriptional repressor LexA